MITQKPHLRVYMMDLLAIVPYYTAYLSRALQQQRVDVEVGSITYYLDLDCFSSRGLKLRPGLLNLVGRFPALPASFRRGTKLIETIINLFALSARFLFNPPDVLHVQFLGMMRFPIAMDRLFVRLAQWRGVRVVLTVHDILPHDTGNELHARYAALYAFVDRLICHSEHIRKRLSEEFGVSEQKVDVIPHGPFFYDVPTGDDGDLRQRYGILPGQKIVLWQGILLPYKGLDVLLDAWNVVEADDESSILLVVGTGGTELVHSMREKAEQLKLKRVIFDFRFVSAQALVELYRAASVVVYPYRAITTSGALATGLALGKAIIASDLPVFRELLSDEEDALLVMPGDPEALGGAALRLLSEDETRKMLSSNVARKNFGTKSWEAIAVDTEKVYEKVLRQ